MQVLGDQVGVDSLLVRGEGHRAWNEILLADNKVPVIVNLVIPDQFFDLASIRWVETIIRKVFYLLSRVALSFRNKLF